MCGWWRVRQIFFFLQGWWVLLAIHTIASGKPSAPLTRIRRGHVATPELTVTSLRRNRDLEVNKAMQKTRVGNTLAWFFFFVAIPLFRQHHTPPPRLYEYAGSAPPSVSRALAPKPVAMARKRSINMTPRLEAKDAPPASPRVFPGGDYLKSNLHARAAIHASSSL